MNEEFSVEPAGCSSVPMDPASAWQVRPFYFFLPKTSLPFRGIIFIHFSAAVKISFRAFIELTHHSGFFSFVSLSSSDHKLLQRTVAWIQRVCGSVCVSLLLKEFGDYMCAGEVSFILFQPLVIPFGNLSVPFLFSVFSLSA